MAETIEPDFRARVRRSFDRQAFMRTIGAELTRVEQGMVEIELPFDEMMTQQHGILHAGIISSALETASTYAGYSVLEPDAGLLTIEFKVNLLSPGRGERFLFRGEVTKPGTTIIVSDGRAYAMSQDAPPKLIASMTATKMVVRGREGFAE